MNQQDLQQISDKFSQLINSASDLKILDDLRVQALGKKGEISALLSTLGRLSVEEKKDFGAKCNLLKQDITQKIEAKQAVLQNAVLEKRLAEESLDITLCATPAKQGKIHPISQVTREVVAIFAELDFSVAEGPEIESEDFNFTKLNIPENHPARQMHDTFYFPIKEDGTRSLLRTHTSPVQIRTMLKQQPPIRILAPGKTYRCDSDMTHTPMFHQVEGLVLDTDIHLGHLRWVLQTFCEKFFERSDIVLRFRPSFFPFTEPSIEIDVQCNRQNGKIAIGEGSDWLEILGAGMVHDNVLRECGYDPETVQGFAFGMGIDRLAMLKYGIPDLRSFFDNDVHWLEHYGFAV